MKPCVAMADSASNGISALPKPDSRPQMATTMLAGTPYWFCMAASCSDHCPILPRPVVASTLSVFLLK